MTNQLQGEVLFRGWDSTADPEQWVYTPWMPVRGDIGTFGVQVLNVSGVTLTWCVETRTAEDPDDVDELFTNQTATTVGTFTITSSPAEQKARQWVRYRFATGGTANTSDYVIFRALQPSWESNR